MGKLVATVIASLDGFINDEQGNFDWSQPDTEVHAFVNDLERAFGTFLYGRRLYDVMQYWETAAEGPEVEHEYGVIWRAADKIVYSTTLTEPSTARTRIEKSFDPDAVRKLKETSERDIAIGGAELTGHAFRAGLVDELRIFLSPVFVGGGTRFSPDHFRVDLTAIERKGFDNGVTYLRYLIKN